MKHLLLSLCFLTLHFSPAVIDPPDWDFDTQLNSYFAAETEKIRQRTAMELSGIKDWPAYQAQARTELQEMLGLLPWPEKTPLKATVTGTVEHEEFTVQKLHFQSMPGLYVTANLYLPKNRKEKAPAIVYVCGHATVTKGGYNYGAKAHYQHHPAWFARNGYVCLILDTVQLGEIEGIHHGLHRYERWWWQSRGYTPAGVEAWNGIRAIDYLQSRPEVDPGRIGITGRSGGGITSWWVAALDDRIKVAVPVAGITDMQDQVVNGCIEDHCDCMFMPNFYQWDFPKLAAMVAPRPLLISNTDRDIMFPVDGVFRVYRQVRAIYDQLGAGEQLALNITSGPHRDEQESRVHAFRWLNRYLLGREDLIDKQAVKFFEPEQLRVFDELPADQINTRIDEVFNAAAPPLQEVLKKMSPEQARTQWRKNLEHVFANWPDQQLSASLEEMATVRSDAFQLTTFRLQTDAYTGLPLFRIRPRNRSAATKAHVIVLDDNNWPDWMARLAIAFPKEAFWEDATASSSPGKDLFPELSGYDELYLVSMRGAGPSRFSGNAFKQAQIRKRFHLLGQTLQSMETWDLRRAVEAIQKNRTYVEQPLVVSADGISAGMALYAALFIDAKLTLELSHLPESHMAGPYYPGILRYMDMPAAVMMAGEMHEIR
ncbi:MAG: CocE/NonD family hydrolase [Saprospiraceae bacterium]|nr:acetylxylan esterase [Lewinella sp.]